MKQTSSAQEENLNQSAQENHGGQADEQKSAGAERTVKRIPANVRVMVALVASPTLLIIAFSVYSVLFGDWKAPGISGIIFSALGLFAYFIVIFGRLPTWFKIKK